MFGKPAPAAADKKAQEPKKKDEGGGGDKKAKPEETNPILHRIQEAILQVINASHVIRHSGSSDPVKYFLFFLRPGGRNPLFQVHTVRNST